MGRPNERSTLWRTRFEPLPDITTYELALDMKHVNASQIVADWEFESLGTALRHRVAETTGQRMDEIARALIASPVSAPPEAK